MQHRSRDTARRLIAAAVVVACLTARTTAGETEATKRLKARTAEFRRGVIQVTDGVHTAIGYSVSAVSMIVGPDGVVIVDTGMDTVSAKAVLADFRKITDKPIRAVIITHSHGDHTGGLPVFTAQGRPQVWARANFGAESRAFQTAGLTFQKVRGARQGGFLLPPTKRINNGVAKAYWPQRGGDVFEAKADVKPTHTVDRTRTRIRLAGLDLDLVPTSGETYDHLYVWFPAKRVVFSGDNFYKSWPNLYPIRGAPYRDVLAWADVNDRMLKEGPHFLVGGHTRPILGKAKVTEVLTNYRDAIRFVFHKTVEGMNKGLTPDELVGYVRLPDRFVDRDYLGEYYGNVEWAVRSIFAGYLGWFDGNPTNLFSLPPKARAERMAGLAGGKDKLLRRAREALAGGDYQWTAELADHLIALDPKSPEPKRIKTDALEKLAESLLTATGRNYYLTVAQQLRAQASGRGRPPRP